MDEVARIEDWDAADRSPVVQEGEGVGGKRKRKRALAADSNQTTSPSQPHHQRNVIVGDFVEATKAVSFMTSVLRNHLT